MILFFFLLMIRRPPRSTRTDTLCPYTTLFRSTTFHALGRGIIEETEGRPPQLANWVEHPAGEARVIDKIIRELMDTNEEFKRLWIDLLSILPKADIPAEAFDSEADYERYIADRNDRGGSTIGTLAEIYVRSLQEQRIAHWLWVHSDRKSTRLNPN